LNQALLFHQVAQAQQQQQQQQQQSQHNPSNNGAPGHHANPLDNLAQIAAAASSARAAQQQAQLKHFLGQASAQQQQQQQQPFLFLQPGSYGSSSLPNLSSQLPGLSSQQPAQANPIQQLQVLLSLAQQGNIPQGSLWNSQQHINSLLAAAASSTVTPPPSGVVMGNGNSQQGQANSLLFNSYAPASNGTQQYQLPVLSSSSASAPLPSNRPSIPIYMDRDEENLTEYQCLLRKQIELFEAGPDDIRSNAQGRNTPILLGQVGLRCRYCAPLPRAARTKGAVYYSQTIDGIYQVAQNMSKVHLCERCHRIPREVQDKLKALRGDNQRAVGGKHYWADGVRALGVYEDGRVLRLNPDSGDASAS
jgi:hypothetical protein